VIVVVAIEYKYTEIKKETSSEPAFKFKPNLVQIILG
jgi:hypothetical protein